MRMFRLFLITVMSIYLLGCDKPTVSMAEFEKFSYEGCLKENKYSNSICACNAANLDKTLSNDEKQNYKKAALGDVSAVAKLLGVVDKLEGAIQNCAK